MSLAAQRDNTNVVTEARIIEGLTREDGKVRAACARRLRDLSRLGQLVIAPGNVIEHDLEYWESKVPRWPCRIKKEDFFEIFEITDQTLTDIGRGKQFFQLDNAFLLEAEIGRRKVDVERIYYRPRAMWVFPPTDFSGIWKCYYVTGELFSETLFDRGVTIGLKRIYNYEGILSWKEEYDEFGTLLLRRHFDADGKLIYVQTDELDIVEDIIRD